MSDSHDPDSAIGSVSHYFSHLSVAAITLRQPLKLGDRIHVKGHTTDLLQEVESMQIEHGAISQARPGDDVALEVKDHVREHDLIFREE